MGVGGWLSKEAIVSGSTFVPEITAPPVLSMKPDNSVPFCMVLVFLKLLSYHWSSEQVSPSEVTPCAGPLKGVPGTLEALCLTQPQSPLIFTARSYEDFSLWHWNPGLGVLV